MSLGALIFMIINLVFIISGFIFFIIMDFKNHKNQKNKITETEKPIVKNALITNKKLFKLKK